MTTDEKIDAMLALIENVVKIKQKDYCVFSQNKPKLKNVNNKRYWKNDFHL